ncbi:MAG TPA: cysteine synthase family protein [Pseudonocardiaceae bacterium]|nr:cysteine synthase family protein [Pseudonocardiaceae bacterium]
MNAQSARPLENIVTRASQLIGRTPLFELCSTEAGTRLLLKLEQFNPTGSAKVRMAEQMVTNAELCGQLHSGGHIIEATSGNTGLGLALVAIERGYRFTAVVDHHACPEKLRAMAAMGAELIYVGGDGTHGPQTVQRRRVATELAAEKGACRLDQHNNPGNPEGYREVAHELLADIFGDVDYLISPIGTGGFLCGTARELRRLGSGVITVGVEPAGSTIFGGPGGKYWQTGSGSPEGFPIGSNVDYSLIDEAVQVSDVDAFSAARVVSRRTGLLVGGSTGGAVYVALRRLDALPADSTVITLVADAGEKYLDTVFNDGWLRKRDLLDPQAEGQVERLLISHRMQSPREMQGVR